MRVRFKTTGNEGEVIDTTYLSAERVGDLNGTWYQVRWQSCHTDWVHADSVQTIYDDPEERWYGLHDGWVS